MADKEVDLLSRVAINHLFLGQFEAFRAIILTLHRRDPSLAVLILHSAIINASGKLSTYLSCSTDSSSPALFSWLSVSLLIHLTNFQVTTTSIPCPDPDSLRIHAEFLLYIHLIKSRLSKVFDSDIDGGNIDKSISLRIWDQIADLGFVRLREDILSLYYEKPEQGEGSARFFRPDERDLEWFKKAVLKVETADIFEALCWNIKNQIQQSDGFGSRFVILENGDGNWSTNGSFEVFMHILRNGQMAHLDFMKNCMEEDHITEAVAHIRYLHLDYGLPESEYSSVLHLLLTWVISKRVDYGEDWQIMQELLLKIYVQALSSSCTSLVQMIQRLHDDIISEEIEMHRSSSADNIPPPIDRLNKYLDATKSSCSNEMVSAVLHTCKRDLFHYCRVSGTHMLECVMDTALSAVKNEQLQEACNILMLFPQIRSLVTVMGWDILSGKTEARKKLMQLLCTSMPQLIKKEEPSMHDDQLDRISCIEHFCDTLCYQLDIAAFVATVNSGNSWSFNHSLLLSKNQLLLPNDLPQMDPFVENYVLERLSFHSPIRVLFDLVPSIRCQDVIKLIRMRPLDPTTEIRRIHDIELIHMRYALEYAVLALGAMEGSETDLKGISIPIALCFLKDFQNHADEITNIPRRIFLVNIIISLLHMDSISSNFQNWVLTGNSKHYFYGGEGAVPDDENKLVVSFTELLLGVLRHVLPLSISEQRLVFSRNLSMNGIQALEGRVLNAKTFIEDWEWRLSVLQRLLPLSERQWKWREALAVLRAAPSTLLSVCMRKAKYDIGEEAVHRFCMPPEDKATLELAEWVDAAFSDGAIEDSFFNASDATSILNFDFVSLRAKLGHLAAIILCIDVAATAAKSPFISKQLLHQAQVMLSEIYPGGSQKTDSTYWEQVHEVGVISVARSIIKCLLDTLEQKSPTVLQAVFIADSVVSSENKGRKDRTISLLHQMIDDAHKGKRQFLSGKLHNLSRAIVDEETDGNIIKGDHSVGSQKPLRNMENGLVFGLGLKATVPDSATSSIQENAQSSVSYDIKDDGRKLFGHLSTKPITYLSQFILHVAAIGDIVDGTDTTHDFNFFSVIYEWPKNILTHLVFDRGSSDAAAKVAEIMSVDFVHEVISTCVPPIYPPKSEHGWASVPLIPTCSHGNSENKVFSPSIKEAKPNMYIFSSSTPGAPLYPLQLDVVKHLAKLSPIRAVLACVFGSNILHQSNDLQIYDSLGDGSPQSANVERTFYEFSLEQSERFPTLNRWIQMQTSLHQVSEFVVSSEKSANISEIRSSDRVTIKRVRDNDTDNESEVDDNVVGGKVPPTMSDQMSRDVPPDPWKNDTANDSKENDSTTFFSFDLENEQIYEKAVERLIDEGKLLDAIALSDRFLHNGASDRLLCLIMKQEEDHYYTATQLQSHHDEDFSSGSWKYCLRLKDKSLAAKLALEYLHHWNLTSAVDVLMMCSCHLSNDDSIKNEIIQSRLALQRYQKILSADSNYKSWQEVEEHSKADPEGLALGLAGKGAVSVALEVCESAVLSTDLRRELQGRQLAKLLTADPLSGGGPAEASRFLSSLGDSDDALPVAVSAMELLPNLRSKQLLVRFFLKRRGGNLSDAEVSRLNLWALGLRVLAALPLPWQQRCSSLHEHPKKILEVLLMRKQLQSASMIMQEFPSLRDDDLLIIYAAKAIDSSFDSTREGRITLSASRPKPKSRTVIPAKPSFTHSLTNLHREARKAFSWAPRNTGEKTAPKDVYRKRKSSGLGPSERTVREETTGIQEDRNTSNIMERQERVASIPISEEWMLTGDPIKDDGIRLSHRYESSPDISLFKEILSLCLDETTSAKAAIDLCVTEMKKVLSSQKLPENASVEAIGRAYHATEVFVQGLIYAKSILRRLAGYAEISSNSERSADGDDISPDGGSQVTDEPCDIILRTEFWLGRAELLQSLLGSGIAACLDDISDKECSGRLRDRLITDERYSMAVYTCKKCKIDSFPVWNSWGHALIQMERYAQARVKFKQALQLHKGEPAGVILDIVGRIEGSPPVDVSAVRAMYEHLARRVPTISDDSLSMDSYLNVLHMPSTFPRSEYYRRFNGSENKSFVHDREFGDWHGSNLDSTRYQECVYYLQEYAPQHSMRFMFEHGHYKDACVLFFPQNSLPSPSRPSVAAVVSSSSSPQRPDPLASDYGTLDDLCELCVTYGVIHVLKGVIMERLSTQHDMAIIQHTSLSLSRICAYCETHKHFNHLYMFQVLSRDSVAAGLCCIQLFLNSSLQDEAIRHLENAKTHFEEGLTTRLKTGDSTTRLVGKGIRTRHASDKITEEELVKLSARISIQVDVVRAFNSADEPQWKFSLFGNPNDPETFRRRCKIGEVLVEKNFDLAFQVIYEFNLPAVHIYAAVAATLAERKRGGQLTEFFRNIKGTIDDDDWDQVVGAAINIYANKHKERPDRLIDMLRSSHRKVLACVVCGRLKTAFQIASRSGSVADVQYIAHQALHSNSLSVLDMCKHWLARYI